MFHFFNKTYLQYHEMFQYSQDSILCFRTDANEVNFDTEVGQFLTGVKSEVLFHAQSADEMIVKYKGDKRFFKELKTYSGSKKNGKLNIFCDPDNFNILTIRMWKTIFPKLDSDAGYMLYDISRNNALFQTRWDWHDEHGTNPNTLHKRYWCLDRESFKTLFEKVDRFEVDQSFLQSISVEYMIALFLSHPEEFKGVLGKKYDRFFSKNLIYDISTLKKELEDQLYELDEIWSELGRQDYDNFDFDEIIRIKPELSFLSNPDFNTASSLDELNMDSLFPVIQDYIAWDAAGCEELLHLHIYIKEGGIPSSESLINFDLNYKSDKQHMIPPILSRMHHKDKVNIYLVQYFAAHRDSLEKFRLD